MTPEDAAKLKTLRFANDVLPCERKRYFALWHAHQGLSSYQIAAMGIMTASRVRHAITTYRQGGLDALSERVHPGRQRRLTPAAAQDLQELLARDDRTWNTQTLAEYLQDTHDITLSRSAVNAQLHRLNLTWQRTRQVVAGQADPEEKAAFKGDLDVVKKGRSQAFLTWSSWMKPPSG